MKNIINLLIFSFIGVIMIGCAAKYGMYEPEQKQALRTLTGGIAGGLISGNTGGAIIGAFVVDLYNLKTMKYEDRQIENGSEAARRYKDRFKKAEEVDKEKKAEEVGKEKKAEEKIDKEKKAEEVGKEKKAEEKIDKEKKAEEIGKERKAEELKEVEKKKQARKVNIFIEEAMVNPQSIKNGSLVEANVRYTLLTTAELQQIEITETRILTTADKTFELAKREVIREPGTYSSTIKFTMPDDIPQGYCILYTTISAGNYAKTTKSVIKII